MRVGYRFCMTSINHFKQNRPVHLARRDAYFEAAVDALKQGGAIFIAGGSFACSFQRSESGCERGR
jgi:hypothetical protein